MEGTFDFAKFFDIASKITLSLGLLLVLIGGWRRVWVWGYQLTECETRAAKRELELKEEIREWKDVNRFNGRMADRSLSIHEERNRRE